MNSPTAVIAEDEPLLRAELRETLNKLWPDSPMPQLAAGFDAPTLNYVRSERPLQAIAGP
jgi:DNA-binding LytR/AlgR family response regulator